MKSKIYYIIILLVSVILLTSILIYHNLSIKTSSINNKNIKTSGNIYTAPDINTSLNFKLPYPVKGYWARENPWNSSLPAVVRDVITFYNEDGEEIKCTIFKLNESSNIGYTAIRLKRGSIVAVKINLTAASHKNANSTAYLLIDIYADLDYLDNYTSKNITLYRALRGWEFRFFPSNLVLPSKPVFIKLDPGESREVELRFKILNTSPQGIFPIRVSIDEFLLENGTLYWYGGVETPYLLIIS
jgi:hypothetical protein